jgi:hypothetical protein
MEPCPSRARRTGAASESDMGGHGAPSRCRARAESGALCGFSELRLSITTNYTAAYRDGRRRRASEQAAAARHC